MTMAAPRRRSHETRGGRQARSAAGALTAYCVNLNLKARGGKIDTVIGPESEINRTIQVLWSAVPKTARFIS